ncbi:4-hydroxy-tetrahydrodipicolinate reductase [Desulfogranum mediterraneum]|uniref:4-hydroxy-tetrahydrodipicolinate reductase n=1 Tax=Desulfogranum mediterraneum TaxID=160661 RepID=UPI00040FCA86|nr:4-hydroxy-tetrahydrodipicolinate reductase [Desulfogranum mediterraneum]
MNKVIVAGAGGRMGQRIIHMVHHHPELELAAAFEHPDSTAVGEDAGVVSGVGATGVMISPGLESVVDQGDVIIDFTFHEASVEFARIAARHKTAMVIGTTGLTPEQAEIIRGLAESSFPCVQSPNMAVGVNVLFKLVEKTAGVLGDAYDVEIVEAHHRLKKDAPSGTALKLGEMAAKGLGRDLQEVGVMERNGIIGERSDTEIGIQTIRGGDIVGEHTVYFAGAGERLEISHRATNRDNFARGAVLAAAWVTAQANGVYTMFDVLDLADF